jgi:MFS family permease
MSKKNIARRAAVASGVGTLVEWYDFFIFGTASALVFPALFFPQYDQLTGTLLSFATFAGGFAARPIGAILFGHLGDRIGRKKTLVATLLIMGLATLAMGLLPTYAAIGVWAPILLVALRLLQGLAVSGEFGGAALMAIEHAPARKRGLYGSAPQITVPIALVASNTVFLGLAAVLSDEQFLAWGWRVPFIVSMVAVVVGLWVRLHVPETPEFAAVKSQGSLSRKPLLDALREEGKSFWLVVFAYPATGMTYYILTTFGISYGVSLGFGRNEMLGITIASAVFMLILIPLGAAWSDRVGRKPVYLTGLAIMAVGILPLFWFFQLGSLWFVLLGFVIPVSGFSLAWGVLTTLFGDSFSARFRYSGLGTAYTLGTILGSSTAPFIATFILAETGSVIWIAMYMLAWILVSFVATLGLKPLQETPRDTAAEVTSEKASARS